MSRVIISIVSHGQESLVQKLIQSMDLYLVSAKHDIQVCVLENYGKQTKISSQMFETSYFFNLRPHGFGANHNFVFQATYSDYFLVLNPDITFHETFDLDQLIDVFESRCLQICSQNL